MSPELDKTVNPSSNAETAENQTENISESSSPDAHGVPGHKAGDGQAAAGAARATEPPEVNESAEAPAAATAESGEANASPTTPSDGGGNGIPSPISESSSGESSASDSPAIDETAEQSADMVSEGDPHATEATDEISAEAMGELINQYPSPEEKSAEPEKKVIEGRVVALNDLGVVVDIGTKREGLIPASEFAEVTTAPPLTPGQIVEVERLGEEKDGYALLSYQRPLRRATWKKIEESFRTKANVEATVTDLIKGGLVVDIGVRAFLPASQVDLKPQSNLESLKGQKLNVRVLKLNRKRGNVVVSHRAILEEENEAHRKQVMESITEGQVIKGRVKNITDYGVFLDLGGVDGLLHITDLSWGRLKHPSEAVKVGEELDVQVLRFDKEKGRVSLGRKQLVPDPWAAVAEKFPAGSRVKGKVVGITDYGAFIELDAGVEGLVHISEMTWSKKMKHPSKIVTQGAEVEALVLEVKPDQRRISLGLKQTQPDPWQQLIEKYPVGMVVTGRVRNLTDFGAFVEIEEGFDGLVHASDISWTGRVKNIGEVLKKGEQVTAKILKIDAPNRRVSLGIKQVNDIWANWFATHKVNEVIRGKVSRMAAFGAFVELADGIEGLCHISEIEDRKRKRDDDKGGQRGGQGSGRQGGKPGEKDAKLEIGKEYDFKIVKLDPDQHRIGLSYRGAQKQVERKEMQEYRAASAPKGPKSSPTATIGDMIRSKGGTI
ncbi:MAG TPA: 30S ribosomal protein S1 [Candidatus Acidoferrales bacterium]|jgi:small subunit ribosomal protein S1|nr:30S ribosomal protein S1 [Candidatus Acidoferrales bacterium]